MLRQSSVAATTGEARKGRPRCARTRRRSERKRRVEHSASIGFKIQPNERMISR